MSSAVVIDVNQRLNEIAVEIKARLKRQLEDVLEIGRLAAEAKSLLPHGSFTDWIEKTLDLSPTLVRAYIRVHERFADKAANFAALRVSAVLLLASPSVSDGTIAEVQARLEDGQKLTVSEVEQIIISHRIIEGAGIGAKALLETHGADVKQVSGAELRSLVQVAEDVTSRGMVTINGEDYVATGGLPAVVQQAVQSATRTRQEAHIGDSAGEWLMFNNVPVAAMVVNGFLTLKIEGIERFFDKGKVIKRVKFLVDD